MRPSGLNSTAAAADVLCRFGGGSGTHVLSNCMPTGSNFYEGKVYLNTYVLGLDS